MSKQKPSGAEPAAKAKPKPKPKPKPKAKPKLLSGGNPQVSLGYGNSSVMEYIEAMPDWKSAVGLRVDALVTKHAPKAIKAVKWNSPMYGTEGLGWFLSFHCFKKYVKIAFFNGGSLEPLPPETSKQENVRYLHVYENDTLDEKQLSSWIKQACKLPGWATGDIK